MQKITPYLWFDENAEEAARYYVSIFKNSKITSVTRESGPKSKVMFVTFRLEGQEFYALNGGPLDKMKFTPAISFFVDCKTQKEVDELWEKLSKGGEKGQCGWLEDKFGLTWQIIPTILTEMLQDKDAKKADRVMKVMLKMSKIEIKTLKQAYNRQ